MTGVRKPTKKKQYCCSGFEVSVLHNYVWKGVEWMIDTGLDGDLKIYFCPWCGKSLDPAPQNTNTVTYDGRSIDGLE